MDLFDNLAKTFFDVQAMVDVLPQLLQLLPHR